MEEGKLPEYKFYFIQTYNSKGTDYNIMAGRFSKYPCSNSSSVGCLEWVEFPQLVLAPLNPIPTAEHNVVAVTDRSKCNLLQYRIDL